MSFTPLIELIFVKQCFIHFGDSHLKGFWFLVHPASKTHWATRIHQLLLSSVASCTSSHSIHIFLRSLLLTPLQFWHGCPGLLLKPSGSQWWVCCGIQWHFMHDRCPSHLSRLHLIMSSNLGSVVASLTFSFVTLSFQEMPILKVWWDIFKVLDVL